MSDASTNTNSNYITCKRWQLAVWPMHTTASAFLTIVLGFANYIATGEFGIGMVAAGIIATASRIFDGVIDPFVAMVTDRVNPKMGAVKFLTLIGRGFSIVSIFGLFFLAYNWPFKFFWYIFFNLLAVVGGTVGAIATHTGNAVLTTNPKQRPMIFRWQMVYTSFIGTLVNIIFTQIIVPACGGITTQAVQINALVMIGLLILFEICAMIAIAPSDKPENYIGRDAGDNVKPKDMLDLIIHNRPLQMRVVAGVTDKIAQQVIQISSVTVLLYGIVIGDYGFSGTVGAYSLIPDLVFLFWGTHLMKKSGGKKAVVQWSWACIIMSMVWLAMMVVIDPTKYGHMSASNWILPLLYIIVQIVLKACNNMNSAATQALSPDIVDYELYRSGRFMPSAIGTIYSFVDETVSSVSNTIVAFCLVAIGYTDVQPQPTDPSSPAVFWMAMFLMIGLPVLGWVCNLIAMKFYILDTDMMEKIQAHNSKLRAENKIRHEHEQEAQAAK